MVLSSMEWEVREESPLPSVLVTAEGGQLLRGSLSRCPLWQSGEGGLESGG